MNADGSNKTLLYDGNPNNSTPATGLAQDGVDRSPDGTRSSSASTAASAAHDRRPALAAADRLLACRLRERPLHDDR